MMATHSESTRRQDLTNSEGVICPTQRARNWTSTSERSHLVVAASSTTIAPSTRLLVRVCVCGCKMAIKVLPLTDEDFDAMRQFVLRTDGQLTTPAVERAMPIASDEAATRRNDWNVQQQRDIFRDDPSARMVKAVDTDRHDEILAVARWHYYARGFVGVRGRVHGSQEERGSGVVSDGL